MLALAGCADATAIEVRISTDLPCDQVRVVTTSIAAGTLEAYETRPPSAVTTRCDAASGHIGSLVLVPHDDDDHARDEVAIRIVTAQRSVAPEDCLSRALPECIVARRVATFVPHRTVTLPVRMQDVCSGVTCGSRQTCSEGRCVSADVDMNAAPCPPAGCERDIGAPDASAPPPEPPHPGSDAVDAGSVPPPGGPPVAIEDAGHPAPTTGSDAGSATSSGSGDGDDGHGKTSKPKKPKPGHRDAVLTPAEPLDAAP
jgi:hypothetical protein